MQTRSIHKPRPISGFPEWLPEIRRVEQLWMDHIRRVFESYGYCSIETPAVEELAVLSAKGADVDKEIYVLERLHKEEGDKEARLALHFDQTVPLARYVAQHFNDLTFPFKRYQMQKVWRGERPQAGRFREFYQCDIDVINVDSLPLHFDAEMPAVMWEILSSLPGMEHERIQIRISNRKILMGLCAALGAENVTDVTRIIDKLEKLDQPKIIGLLAETGMSPELALTILELARIKSNPKEFSGLLRDFIARNDVIARSVSDAAIQTLQQGIDELSFVMDQLSHLPAGAVVADLSIVRGLDYYTGTVYETVFLDDPSYGSICSGGRYDDLAGNYINKHLPGAGISIGLSRLFERIKSQNKLPAGASSPTQVLVILPSEDLRSLAQRTAKQLRERGFNVEVFHADSKLKRQLAYAEKKGIRYVWFPPFENSQSHEVKDMSNGTQSTADPATWIPETDHRG
jgi:histidyl-tRNA synthetase